MNSPHYSKFELQKIRPILAIDYGKKYVGTALLVELQGEDPGPFIRLDNPNRNVLLQELYKIFAKENIQLVVVGIPHLLDGAETEMGKIIKRFMSDLKSKCPNPNIIFAEQDETLSSFEAESRMKKSPLYNFRVDKEKIDCLAAAIILEDFIRS